MKFRLPRGLRCIKWRRINPCALLTAVMVVTAMRVQAETVTLERAIRLALAHSTSSAIADADVQRAFASYRELHASYLPQVGIGSGLGWSYGFPLSIEGSAPALADAAAQSTVFNSSQRELTKAAKIEWHAAEIQGQDQRNAIIQDVALTYSELAKWEARLLHLQPYEAQARQMEQAVAERQQAGVDSVVDLNKARLISARVRLHQAEARGSADVLRQRLSALTGLPVSAIEIAPETIPALPPVAAEPNAPEKALASSLSIKFAEQHSLAESMRAVSEHRALYPTIDFSAQYARLSTINNYNLYYRKFQPDNATVGFALRIPLFNAAQRARIEEAKAEALKAKKQADATRDQVAEETLKLQRAAEQFDAAREVAELEYQLAQSNLEATQTRVESKTGTLHELADARVQAAERFLLFQDADFAYRRARMNLLRATGELETWALPGSTPSTTSPAK